MDVRLEHGSEVVVRRVDATKPDLALVDVLARMQLEARRRGLAVELVDPPPALCALLAFCGLAELLGLDARRQPELGEPIRADEVVQSRDPPA